MVEGKYLGKVGLKHRLEGLGALLKVSLLHVDLARESAQDFSIVGVKGDNDIVVVEHALGNGQRRLGELSIALGRRRNAVVKLGVGQDQVDHARVGAVAAGCGRRVGLKNRDPGHRARKDLGALGCDLVAVVGNGALTTADLVAELIGGAYDNVIGVVSSANKRELFLEQFITMSLVSVKGDKAVRHGERLDLVVETALDVKEGRRGGCKVPLVQIGNVKIGLVGSEINVFEQTN